MLAKAARSDAFQAASGPLAYDAGGLRFDSQDDALDFGRNLAERSKRWLARQGMTAFERYIEGGSNLVIHARVWAEAHELYFLFRRVPPAVADRAASNEPAPDRKAAHHHGRSYWDHKAMSSGVPYAIQSPKEGIASLVWLERREEGAQLRRISAEGATIELPVYACGVPREREAGSLRVSSTEDLRGAVDRVVQCVTQRPNCVFQDHLDFIGELPGEAKLMDVLATLWIGFDEAGYARLEIGDGPGLRFVDFFECVAD